MMSCWRFFPLSNVLCCAGSRKSMCVSIHIEKNIDYVKILSESGHVAMPTSRWDHYIETRPLSWIHILLTKDWRNLCCLVTTMCGESFPRWIVLINKADRKEETLEKFSVKHLLAQADLYLRVTIIILDGLRCNSKLYLFTV